MAVRGALALITALVACSPSRLAPPTPEQLEADREQAVLAKLFGYSQCLDEHSGRVFEIADAYGAETGGKPPDPRAFVFVRAPKEPKRCVDAIRDSNKLEPRIAELEAAGDAFASALTIVYDVTSEGQRDYDRGSKTYDLARGAALYPKLVAAFSAFDDAQGALFDQVYRRNHEIRVAQLGRQSKKEGPTLAVISDTMILRAEELVRFGALPWDHLEQLDVASISRAISEYEGALGDLTAYEAAHAKDVIEAMKGFWLLEHAAGNLLAASKQLVLRAREQVAYTDAEKIMIEANNEAGIVGSPAAMVTAYNRLLDQYAAK